MSPEHSREREAAITHDLDPGSYTALRLVWVSMDDLKSTKLTGVFSNMLRRSIST